VCFELEVSGKMHCPVKLGFEFWKGEDVTKEIVSEELKKRSIIITHSKIYETPCNSDKNFIAIRLLTPEKLKAVSAKITIMEI